MNIDKVKIITHIDSLGNGFYNFDVFVNDNHCRGGTVEVNGGISEAIETVQQMPINIQEKINEQRRMGTKTRSGN